MITKVNLFNEDEWAMVLYICNVLLPLDIPKIEFDEQTIKWFRFEQFVNKLIQAEPRVKPEYKALFDGLMNKLGIDIKRETPTQPTSGSLETNDNKPKAIADSGSIASGSISANNK